MISDTKCFRCMDTGKVLGEGVYQYEPCPRCKPSEREAWELKQAAEKAIRKQKGGVN